MLPPPLASILGIAKRQARNRPRRSDAMVRSKVSMSISTASPSAAIKLISAALLNRPSRRPCFATRSTEIPASTSLAPSAARRRAALAPRPCEAPSTTITFEANLVLPIFDSALCDLDITQSLVSGLLGQRLMKKMNALLVLADERVLVSPKRQPAGAGGPHGSVLLHGGRRSKCHVGRAREILRCIVDGAHPAVAEQCAANRGARLEIRVDEAVELLGEKHAGRQEPNLSDPAGRRHVPAARLQL